MGKKMGSVQILYKKQLVFFFNKKIVGTLPSLYVTMREKPCLEKWHCITVIARQISAHFDIYLARCQRLRKDQTVFGNQSCKVHLKYKCRLKIHKLSDQLLGQALT